VIAWGNELGDYTADTAMTRRGFGEMAITGTIAGPLFNILVGLGAANTYTILDPSTSYNYVVYSLYVDGENGEKLFDPVAVLPLVLMVGQFFILCILMVNGVANHFKISFKWTYISVTVYLLILIGLIAFSLIKQIKPPTG
jgi:Ca2+/Na+ antiporter